MPAIHTPVFCCMPEFNAASLLSILHVSSPALPIGAYAYSGGLEALTTLNYIKNGEELTEWLKAQLETAFTYLDLPILLRLYNSTVNAAEFSHWESLLLASRETKELKNQETQLGQSLANVFKQLTCEPPRFSTYLGGLAHWYCHHSIPSEALLVGYCWSFIESQTAAAAKLLTIGQSELQRILFALYQPILAACNSAVLIENDEIGAALPCLSFASSLHETQFARMFRS